MSNQTHTEEIDFVDWLIREMKKNEAACERKEKAKRAAADKAAEKALEQATRKIQAAKAALMRALELADHAADLEGASCGREKSSAFRSVVSELDHEMSALIERHSENLEHLSDTYA
jgi:flagellar biosynthesis/type III secretory pathway protein FliH